MLHVFNIRERNVRFCIWYLLYKPSVLLKCRLICSGRIIGQLIPLVGDIGIMKNTKNNVFVIYWGIIKWFLHVNPRLNRIWLSYVDLGNECEKDLEFQTTFYFIIMVLLPNFNSTTLFQCVLLGNNFWIGWQLHVLMSCPMLSNAELLYFGSDLEVLTWNIRI